MTMRSAVDTRPPSSKLLDEDVETPIDDRDALFGERPVLGRRFVDPTHDLDTTIQPYVWDDMFSNVHNGGIDDFRHIKRDLVRLLNDKFFLWITGQTDSEYIFAFFLQMLIERYGEELPKPEQVAACFQHTFDMMEVLGQDSCLRRLRNAIARIPEPAG